MARNFNSATSRLVYSTVTSDTFSSGVTISFWALRLNSGAGGYGRILLYGNSSARYGFYNDNGDAGWGLAFSAYWTGGTAYWSIAYPDTSWHHYAITYAYSSTADDPIIYKDGVSQTVIERVAPSGSKGGTTNDFYIGNLASPDRYWGGYLAELAIYNRQLSSGEVVALSKGLAPVGIPRGLVSYVPMMGRYTSEPDIVLNATATITATENVAHPRIIYPSTSFIRRFTTASGGGSAGVLGTSIGDLEYAAYAVKTGKIGITLNEQKMTYYTSVLGQQYASVTEAEVAFLKSKTSKWTETSIADLWNSYYTTRGVPNYPSLHDRAMYFYLNVGFE